MLSQAYRQQVALLLDALPEIGKEKCFAMHGGTAINLFVRDMPRLSVDIDLTYVVIEERNASIKSVNEALARIAANLTSRYNDIKVRHRADVSKLYISRKGVEIKVEVNMVGRGIIGDPINMPLSEKAQEAFEAFVEFPIVPIGQLYGGKVCAAFDRQHPRDLFDIKHMLNTEGFSDTVKTGFIYCLLGSDRPMNEILRPNYKDQRQAMENQFDGMATEEFPYEEYEAIRVRLVEEVNKSLTEEDRKFLMSVKDVEPDWNGYDYAKYPSVRWKLQNLEKLKTNNPEKHRQQADALRAKLWPVKDGSVTETTPAEQAAE